MTAGKLFFVALLLVLLAAGIGLVTDLSQLARELIDFHWPVLLPALVLALANYLLRFGKWHFFLHAIRHPVPALPSALVFHAGLAMSVTPGKVGELLKAHLLQRSCHVPPAATVPVVIAERLTDLMALLALALFGVVSSGYGFDIMIAATAICAAVIVPVLWQHGGQWLVDQLTRLSFMRRHREALLNLREALFQLVGARNLLIGTAISVAAWAAECLAFFLILGSAGVVISLADALFIYSLGTIAGAVTMLPGGLVATEAGMVFLLVEFFAAADPAQAVTSVLLVRLCTLWFAVLVGLAALAAWRWWLRGGPNDGPGGGT